MITTFRGQYSWASNFYSAPFYVQTQLFKTSEHYFAACKTTDSNWCQWIIDAETPAKAKKYGQQCPIRPDWPQLRVGVMAQALWYKFTQNPELQNKLLETYPQHMEEGNRWHDNFWGNCICPKCANIEGKNALGLLLMAHRDTFRTMRILTYG
jgi:ribA/ribD-fused uncharacterized protein